MPWVVTCNTGTGGVFGVTELVLLELRELLVKLDDDIDELESANELDELLLQMAGSDAQ